MSQTVQEWINALDRLGKRPETKGRRTMGLCPAHADTDRSLSVNEGNGGTALVHCFAGCDFEAVRDAMGFEPPSGPRPPIRPRPAKTEEPEEPPEPRPLPSGPGWWEPFIYTDAAGTPVLAVVRKDLGKNAETGRMRKTYPQYLPAPDAPGLWLPGGIERDRPLYHLPKLAASPTDRVVVVEGEKCVEACETAWPSRLATTFAGGGNAWQRTDYEPLRGRDVSLVSDADEGGRTAMRQLAYHLDTELDCVVQIALLEGETKEDIADWLKADGPEAAGQRVAALLVDYNTELSDKTEPPADRPPPLEGDIESNPHYRLLGLAGEQVAFWVDGQVALKTRESLMKVDTLLGLARGPWLRQIAEENALGSSMARRVGDSILTRAIQIGQVDVSALTGRGAFRLPDGTIGYHLARIHRRRALGTALEEARGCPHESGIMVL